MKTIIVGSMVALCSLSAWSASINFNENQQFSSDYLIMSEPQEDPLELESTQAQEQKPLIPFDNFSMEQDILLPGFDSQQPPKLISR